MHPPLDHLKASDTHQQTTPDLNHPPLDHSKASDTHQQTTPDPNQLPVYHSHISPGYRNYLSFIEQDATPSRGGNGADPHSHAPRRKGCAISLPSCVTCHSPRAHGHCFIVSWSSIHVGSPYTPATTLHAAGHLRVASSVARASAQHDMAGIHGFDCKRLTSLKSGGALSALSAGGT